MKNYKMIAVFGEGDDEEKVILGTVSEPSEADAIESCFEAFNTDERFEYVYDSERETPIKYNGKWFESIEVEEEDKEMTNERLWYAVQIDSEDDWGTGSYDKAEAIEMLMSNEAYTLIAVISGAETNNAECIEEIYKSDL